MKKNKNAQSKKVNKKTDLLTDKQSEQKTNLKQENSSSQIDCK
ncbi:MAG: hypothetical protein RSB71_04150 [Bacilli bacterium]